jgi:uncharacterized protein YacL
MMLKVTPKKNKWYMITIGVIYGLLIISILILAAFTRNTVFWVVAVIIDIVVILLGVRAFIKMNKPLIVTPPMEGALEYYGGKTNKSEEKIAEVNPDDKEH